MKKNVWRAAIISALCAVLTAAFLLGVGLWFALKGEDPQKSAAFWPRAALYAGSIAGGIVASAFQKQGSAGGTLAGALLYVGVVTLITLPFGKGFAVSKMLTNALVPLGIMMLTGFLCSKGGGRLRYNPQKQAKRIGKNYKRKYKIR